MMRFHNTLIAVVLFSFFSTAALSAQETTKTDWKAYSKELLKSIDSDNEGVKLSALQRIIQYSDSLNITNARYSVMNIFMKNKNQKVRQLALAALSKINHPLDLGRLELHFKWEKDPVIKMHISFVLLENGWISYKEYGNKYQVAEMSE